MRAKTMLSKLLVCFLFLGQLTFSSAIPVLAEEEIPTEVSEEPVEQDSQEVISEENTTEEVVVEMPQEEPVEMQTEEVVEEELIEQEELIEVEEETEIEPVVKDFGPTVYAQEVDRLTFHAGGIPKDGDLATIRQVTVEEEGIAYNEQGYINGYWLDETDTPLPNDHVFTVGEKVKLSFTYAYKSTHKAGENIENNTTVDGKKPTYHDLINRQIIMEYTVVPKPPTDVAWKDDTLAIATWKGVAGANKYIVQVNKNGEYWGAQTVGVDLDHDGIPDGVPDVDGTLYEWDFSRWINTGGSDDYIFTVVAVLTETPWIASDTSTSQEKSFVTYPITVDNGTAMDYQYRTLWQALPGTKVIVTYEDAPHPEYAIFHHFEFLSGITTFDIEDRKFTMPSAQVHIKPIYEIYAMDLGNIWTKLSPVNKVAFTTALDPEGILDSMVTINDERWANKDEDIFPDSDVLPKLNETYQYYVLLGAKDGYIFSENKFEPFIYGGSEVPLAKQEKTIAYYGKEAQLTWGLQVTVNPVNLNDSDLMTTINGVVDKVYTGKEITQTPVVKVIVDGENVTLTKDKDYTISYKNNINVGIATLTITGKGNYTGTISKTFKITSVAVTGVTVSPTTATLTVGKTTTLKATVNPTTATNKKVTWTSSNNNVAKVDNNGKVTAVNGGTATITVTTQDGKKTAKATITVNMPKVQAIAIYNSAHGADIRFKPINGVRYYGIWRKRTNPVTKVLEEKIVKIIDANTYTEKEGGNFKWIDPYLKDKYTDKGKEWEGGWV